MKMKKAFTLAEVLITLAVIGVVAAISIPSVVANTQQKEFQTGLRKAVSVLNSAITMNMAIDGESPYENKNTFEYLQRHMSVMKSTNELPFRYTFRGASGATGTNAGFYTTDGMRFEVDDYKSDNPNGPHLHESGQRVCILTLSGPGKCNGCGSYGLNHNPNNTTKPPCILLVDVNGDRKPAPSNVNCTTSSCQGSNFYKYPSPDANKLLDIFGIMITDDRAVPFGVVAQRAMYQAQKSK